MIDRKCNIESCKLKNKCISYRFGKGQKLNNWFTCFEYNNFESIDPYMQKYKNDKLEEYLTKNNLSINYDLSNEE